MVKMRQGGHWQKETRSAAQKTASDEMPPWYKHAKKRVGKMGDIPHAGSTKWFSARLSIMCLQREVEGKNTTMGKATSYEKDHLKDVICKGLSLFKGPLPYLLA